MKKDVETIAIRHMTKGKLPSLPFARMKDAVLGTSYELSLVFANRETSRELNRVHRDKDYATNILSFPLTKHSGEIVINLEKVRKDAKEFEKTYEDFLGFLFIHGLLHLKGMDHGPKMEAQEKKFCKIFNY